MSSGYEAVDSSRMTSDFAPAATGSSSSRHQDVRNVCRYFMKGICRYGSNCRYFHPVAGEHDCGICYDKITSFGLLNCKCKFCLDCIRAWRSRGKEIQQKETVRLCPLCRTETLHVIPSPVYVDDTEQKNKLRDEYIQHLNIIPCKVILLFLHMHILNQS